MTENTNDKEKALCDLIKKVLKSEEEKDQISLNKCLFCMKDVYSKNEIIDLVSFIEEENKNAGKKDIAGIINRKHRMLYELQSSCSPEAYKIFEQIVLKYF